MSCLKNLADQARPSKMKLTNSLTCPYPVPWKTNINATAVQEILERIEQLPMEERLLLENRLAELSEIEWRREADQARSKARAVGLDQAKIDQAIEELRHPA